MDLPMNLPTIEFWHWWIAALLLLVIEALLPGAVFLWMGISAAIVGALLGLFGIGWQAQLMLFGLLSLVSFMTYRRWARAQPAAPKSTLNRRGDSYVGRDFTLTDPIVNGIGKLSVDDSQWRITGHDAPAGSRVRVTRADGVTLHVERLN